jgi:CubicO group peptidase (beta-lactamase class C family)
MQHAKPSAPFRDVSQYNNLMYVALGSLSTYLLGESLSSYVQKNLFDPLGMESATFSPEKAEASGRLARGFGRDGVNFTEDIFGMGTPQAMRFHWSSPEGSDHCKSCLFDEEVLTFLLQLFSERAG